jgi:hypothetical protein
MRMQGVIAAGVVAALVAGCHPAILNGAIALGASAFSRSQGGCYASCAYGTTCNRDTGMCEAPPCGGTCRADEVCDVGPGWEKCVSAGALGPGTAPRDDGSGR